MSVNSVPTSLIPCGISHGLLQPCNLGTELANY